MTKTVVVLIALLVFATLIPSSDKAKTVDTSDLPTYFSWRNINGIDFTTPIKDQSPAPTCEAYALCASLETIMQYQLREIYNPDLSETHLYFYPGGSYEKGYVNLMDAANYLIRYGVPDEGCYPDPHRAFDYPFESLPGWQNRTVKIREWGWVPREEDAIKQSLIQHGPLIACFIFGTDFYFYSGGVYEHVWGRIAGGHVVAIVGYDDSERCWIVKNSWGTSWGENGWFRLSYDADLFADWYGKDTGIMYITGVYGILKPDAPRVQIEAPLIFHNYYFGREFPTIFRKLPFFLEASPRIFGSLQVKITAENTNQVEFYIDNIKQYTDDQAPFIWEIKAENGFHTLEVRAINDRNTSLGIIDLYIFTNN